MQVRYEPPINDLSYVVAAPIILDMEKNRGCLVARWSLAGLVPEPGMALAGGDATITFPYQGFGISMQCRLSYDADSNLLRFVELGDREEQVLRHIYRQVVTGRTVSVNQIITTIEAPTEKVPMEQTPEEISTGRKRLAPRLARVGFAVCAYALLATIAYQPIVLPMWDALRAESAPVSRVANR